MSVYTQIIEKTLMFITHLSSTRLIVLLAFGVIVAVIWKLEALKILDFLTGVPL